MALAALIIALAALGVAVAAWVLLGKVIALLKEMADELLEWAQKAELAAERDKLLKRAKLK